MEPKLAHLIGAKDRMIHKSLANFNLFHNPLHRLHFLIEYNQNAQPSQLELFACIMRKVKVEHRTTIRVNIVETYEVRTSIYQRASGPVLNGNEMVGRIGPALA